MFAVSLKQILLKCKTASCDSFCTTCNIFSDWLAALTCLAIDIQMFHLNTIWIYEVLKNHQQREVFYNVNLHDLELT